MILWSIQLCKTWAISFFLTGHAGTGKTYTYNTICHQIRSQRKIVLCVASSGIAALLLFGGRTSHSCFKIPLKLHEDSVCNIKKNSDLAELLRHVSLIIWNEVPMQKRFAPEAVDRTMRDIRGNDRPFGGVTVVFGGDFKQILPVVVKGSRNQIVSSSLCRSPLWSHVQVLHLTENMRLSQADQEKKDFAQWLLEVGEGGHTDSASNLEIPEQFLATGNTVDNLIASIYPGITNPIRPDNDFFTDRTILSARNDDVDDINHRILTQFPGHESIFNSADSVVTEAGTDSDIDYPIEYLNSIKTSGLPLAHLKLKPGCPLMILRNLDAAGGICNGTRAILLRSTNRVLEVRLLGGEHAGQTAFIPRMNLSPTDEELPFAFRRRQFPVRIAFAMTINKSQGQSVKHVGLDLRTPIFTHGQLYVALSRVTSVHRIKIILPTQNVGTTKNIVFKEVLLTTP